MALNDFDEAARTNFKNSLASFLGVSGGYVSIEAVSAGSINVETAVFESDSEGADVQGTISASSNTELSTALGVSVTASAVTHRTPPMPPPPSPPPSSSGGTSSGSSKDKSSSATAAVVTAAALSSAGAIGMGMGVGVGGLCCLVGVCYVLRRRSRKRGTTTTAVVDPIA
jgi:hypothetical protein